MLVIGVSYGYLIFTHIFIIIIRAGFRHDDPIVVPVSCFEYAVYQIAVRSSLSYV